MPIDLSNVAMHLGQMLINHRDLPWNQPPEARAKMPPELRILFDLFDELRTKGLSQAPSQTSIKAFLNAAKFLALHSGDDAVLIASEPQARMAAFRKAALKLHPDQGGNGMLFRELMGHNQILEWAEKQ